MKRSDYLHIILSIMILFTIILFCSAVSAEIIYSGECGYYAAWTLDDEGTLSITGTGKIQRANWRHHKNTIKKVIIENGITNICERAFFQCENLIEINIPESITSIAKEAISECTSLTQITIPSSVISIENNAFSYCKNLITATLKCGITGSPYYYFTGCSKLSSFIIPSTHPNYRSIDGVLFNKTCDSLILYPFGKKGDYTIPKTVTSIYENAFADCAELTTLTIPSNVEYIEEKAIHNCQALKTINFQASIPDFTFYTFFHNCPNLTSVNISSNHRTYSSIDGVVFNKDKSILIYYPHGRRGKYTIPNTVTKIGSYAFYYCANLTEFKMSSNVRSIQDYAFAYCTGLTNVAIAEGIEDIGNSAFIYCKKLNKINLPTSLKRIGKDAFLYCSIKKVTLGKRIEYIWGKVFEKSVTIYAPKGSYAAKWAYENYYDLIETAPEYTIDIRCSSGGKATATPSVGKKGTKITLEAIPDEGYIFSGWATSSDKIKIKDNKFTLGSEDIRIEAWFEEDPSYSIVKDGLYKLNKEKNTATYIKPQTTDETSVKIPATIKVDNITYKVTEIKANAFKGCTFLSKLTIGENIKKIGKAAAKDCTSLKTIIIKTTLLTKKSVGKDSFKNIHQKATFKCPKGKAKDYKKIFLNAGAPATATFK